MKTIWKFTTHVDDTVHVPAPQGASWLHVEREGPATLTLWAVVDPDAPPVRHQLHVRGTGHPLGEVGPHIGTVLDPPFVWHVFEGAADA